VILFIYYEGAAHKIARLKDPFTKVGATRLLAAISVDASLPQKRRRTTPVVERLDGEDVIEEEPGNSAELQAAYCVRAEFYEFEEFSLMVCEMSSTSAEQAENVVGC